MGVAEDDGDLGPRVLEEGELRLGDAQHLRVDLVDPEGLARAAVGDGVPAPRPITPTRRGRSLGRRASARPTPDASR
jgi:hypothetical protein